MKNPGVGRWSIEEDNLLKEAVLICKSWIRISKLVPGRDPLQCQQRWTKVLKPGIVKGNWSEKEDEALKKWVSEHGPTKWGHCAKTINGRSGKQCRDRWTNKLDPTLKIGNWTKAEDESLFHYYKMLDSRWSIIGKLIPNRSENSVKNRFYSTIRRMLPVNDRKNPLLKLKSQMSLPKEPEIIDREKL